MKTTALRFVPVLFHSLWSLLACQSAATILWEVIGEHDVHHGVMTAGFLNEKYGITGGPGNMNHTTDDGQTWSKDNNNSECRYGMEIFNDQHA